METINDRITKEDVKDVASEIGLVITETEADWVLLCYEDYARQDPTATWNLIVEDIIWNIPRLKNNS